jgi:hypothetical protein
MRFRWMKQMSFSILYRKSRVRLVAVKLRIATVSDTCAESHDTAGGVLERLQQQTAARWLHKECDFLYGSIRTRRDDAKGPVLQ